MKEDHDDLVGRTTPRRIDPERLKDGQLKELANRLLRLPYRDMLVFAEAISQGVSHPNDQTREIANAALDWADKLGATA